MISTVLAKIDIKNIDYDILTEAAQIIKSGGLVAFPTETVYGLGANALDKKAIEKIFSAKHRPPDNPLISHISDISQLELLTEEITPLHKKLMEKFWPGPLTLLFRKKNGVPDVLSAGLPTVTIRFPSHPIACELIKLSQVLIAAPSANLSGKPSPTRAEHVWEDLNGAIDMIIDGGPADYGVESTVVDPLHTTPRILRNGALSIEDIRLIVPDIADATQKTDTPPLSPGMKYRHYAPCAKVILLDSENMERDISDYLEKNSLRGKEIGAILLRSVNNLKVDSYVCKDTNEMSARLFDLFRSFDKKNKKIIFVQKPPGRGIGKALLDRLEKASEAASD